MQRILMGHALIASYGGIPLIYMGDELALLNDCGYLDVPDHAHDSRWIHRPRMDWALAAERAQSARRPAARVFRGTRQILARRARDPGAAWRERRCEVVRAAGAGRLRLPAAWPRRARCCACSTSPTAGSNLPEGWVRAQGVTPDA